MPPLRRPQNIITALEVFFMRDVVWAVSSIFLSIGVAIHSKGKPIPVFVALCLGAALVLVALLSSLGKRTRGVGSPVTGLAANYFFFQDGL